MTEMVLSPGVKLAWRLAGDLAFHEKDPFIEPRHLFFGIFSLGKLVASAKKEHKREDPTVGVEPEAEQLDELVRRHGLDIPSLRRAIRRPSARRVPQSSTASPRALALSRSEAARRIFEQAATETTQIDVLSLLRALLQAHDPQIEQATAPMQEGLAAMLRELQPAESKTQQVPTSLDPRLTDLDTVVSQEFRPVVEITEAVDTRIAIQAYQALDPIKRLTLLSELTWEFGTQGLLDPMLQKAVEHLLRLVSTGERCAILVNDGAGSELLLKAHGPLGTVPMISMTSAKRAIAEQKGFIWSRGKELTRSQKESNVESGMYVPLVVNGQAIGVICIDCSCPQQSLGRDDLLLVTSLAHQLALAIANHELHLTLKQNTDVLERLLTNFSPKVRTRLLQRAQMGRLRLGGEQSVVSVLCADIRGFTKLTAGMQTDDVVSLLNEYFAALTECIFRNDGTIDKFVGDAILAVFGSPEADPQHCRKAVLAGMEMQEAAREVSKRRKAKAEVSCEIGIGIHTGQVLHGFIGSPERMEFTIIGEAVNRTSRYCDGAKGSEVLISPEIYQHLWSALEVQQISIPTKHEGDFVAYRVQRVRDPGERTVIS
jgi:adenylate cyclase